MAELFTNPMTSMTEAYKGTSAMLEDVAASQDLKAATEQTPVEKEVNEQGQPVADKPVDLFKVNSLAAQMAAQRGDTRSSDKFMKQAQEYKKDDLIIQSKELAVAQDKLEAMEQQINSITNPADAIDAVMKSKVPQDRKLAEIAKIRAIGDDPEKFKAYKDQLQSSVMTAKDRLSAADRALKMKQQHEEKMELIKDRQARDRQTAAIQLATLDLQREKFDWQKEYKSAELKFKEARTEVEIDKNLQKELSKVDKDPLLKPAAKNARKAELRAAAEDQKEVLRGGKSGGGKDATAKDIPQDHITYLLNNDTPENRASFDRKYGKGSANEFIERNKQENRK